MSAPALAISSTEAQHSSLLSTQEVEAVMAQISSIQEASDSALAALEKKFRAKVTKARGALAIAEQAMKSAQAGAALAADALTAQSLELGTERAEKVELRAQIFELQAALAARSASDARSSGLRAQRIWF